jgi:hypothetical protein
MLILIVGQNIRDVVFDAYFRLCKNLAEIHRSHNAKNRSASDSYGGSGTDAKAADGDLGDDS